jgi:pyruvate formate lyase activating enzyme
MASELMTAAAPSRISVAALTAPTCAVQHFCIHDGPGIRSTVFFKGCPLSCVWCQNPESISPQPQLAFKAHLCVDGCHACVDACLTGAMTAPGQWSDADCTHCRACVDLCPSQAMVGYGEERTVAELLAELEPEFGLYRSSGGGVTFSGGEATMHPEMLAAMATRLKDDSLHLTLETSGQFRVKGLTDAMVQPGAALDARVEAQPLWQALRRLDLVLFDLKLFDREAHQRFCGATNVHIHDNFRRLTALAAQGRGPRVWPRIPLVPGVTDTPENLRGLAGLIRAAGLEGVTVLPYHPLGNSKREWLGEAEFDQPKMMSEDAVRAARGILAAEGLRTFLAGEETDGRV